MSVATKDEVDQHTYDVETFEVLYRMLKDDSTVPIMICQQTEYREHIRQEGIDQFTLLERFHPNFKMLTSDELPAGCTHGATFTTIMYVRHKYPSPMLQLRSFQPAGLIHRVTSPIFKIDLSKQEDTSFVEL